MENVSTSRLAGLKQLVNWQFHVWPVGGIVIKARKRRAAIRKSIVSVKWWHSRPADEVLAVSRDVASDATTSLAALRNHSSALHLCGFPRFLPGGIILQDLKNSANTSVSGTVKTIEVEIDGVPYFFLVSPTSS